MPWVGSSARIDTTDNIDDVIGGGGRHVQCLQMVFPPDTDGGQDVISAHAHLVSEVDVGRIAEPVAASPAVAAPPTAVSRNCRLFVRDTRPPAYARLPPSAEIRLVLTGLPWPSAYPRADHDPASKL
jgi:hypothetical protein